MIKLDEPTCLTQSTQLQRYSLRKNVPRLSPIVIIEKDLESFTFFNQVHASLFQARVPSRQIPGQEKVTYSRKILSEHFRKKRKKNFELQQNCINNVLSTSLSSKTQFIKRHPDYVRTKTELQIANGTSQTSSSELKSITPPVSFKSLIDPQSGGKENQSSVIADQFLSKIHTSNYVIRNYECCPVLTKGKPISSSLQCLTCPRVIYKNPEWPFKGKQPLVAYLGSPFRDINVSTRPVKKFTHQEIPLEREIFCNSFLTSATSYTSDSSTNSSNTAKLSSCKPTLPLINKDSASAVQRSSTSVLSREASCELSTTFDTEKSFEQVSCINQLTKVPFVCTEDPLTKVSERDPNLLFKTSLQPYTEAYDPSEKIPFSEFLEDHLTHAKQDPKFLRNMATLFNGVSTGRSMLGRQAGLGLFADRDFKKNEIITEYTGTVIDRETALQMRSLGASSHVIRVGMPHSYINGFSCPSPFIGGGSFANDGRMMADGRTKGPGNNAQHFVWYDQRRGRDRVFLKARKDIPKGVEILIGYDNNYWKFHHSRLTY